MLQVSEELPAFQRGDWEPPDTLMLVYEQDWHASLSLLVELAKREVDVTLVAKSRAEASDARSLWPPGSTNVRVLNLPLDTPWVRDFGPLQLRGDRGELWWLDPKYSDERAQDDRLPELVAELFEVPLVEAPFSLDGGGLSSNGRGLCAMTDMSFYDLQIAMEEPAVQDETLRALGCQALVVTPAIPNEPTGHIDMLVQFVAPDRALVAYSAEEHGLGPAEVEHAVDVALEAILAGAQALGQPLEVVRVPLVVQKDLFYSYVNGVGLDRQYFAPSFASVPQSVENAAHLQLQSALPQHQVFPIDAELMAARGGALHCVTLGLALD